MKASLLITFYNNLSELDLILKRLMLLGFDIEIIIADDGSKIRSNEIFTKYRNNGLKIKHIWQPDRGFRASKIRNLAVLCSNYDYLIFHLKYLIFYLKQNNYIHVFHNNSYDLLLHQKNIRNYLEKL